MMSSWAVETSRSTADWASSGSVQNGLIWALRLASAELLPSV